MDTLKVKNFGPVEEANVEFGDFTLLVGPQASGKSIFLQLLKLIEDKDFIINILKEYGYVWQNSNEFLELFLGEGMNNIWEPNTSIFSDGIALLKGELSVSSNKNEKFQQVIYVPAQRVITLLNGWPKPFSDFGNDPFVLKDFSDFIRLFMEIGPGAALFPDNDESLLRDSMYRSIFYDGILELDKSNFRKRFILKVNKSTLPYMMWSAGQKEFMPLWLAIYLLMHPGALLFAHKRTIIIEEPEMGLHPKAIKELILEMLELISMGYKVIVSTHSPMFLEFVWAIKMLKDNKAKHQAMYELFEKDSNERWDKVFDYILENKQFKTFYFNKKEHGGSIVKDISSLDAFSEDDDIAEWGGLSSFSGKASEIVAKTISL